MAFDRLSENFIRYSKNNCAVKTFSAFQKIYYVLLAAVLTGLLIYRWDWWVFTVSALLMMLYFFSGVLKIAAALAGWRGGELRVNAEELAQIRQTDLPVYTILLPLYREEAVAAKILKHIRALDYPQELLDVKFLLEADDRETLAALSAADLPENFEVMVMPEGMPKTKPRACNYGLEAARGEFTVIFDAEDKPDPDQLLKAVAVFRRRNMQNTACVQAKLNYFNRRQNLLTRLFTIEYSTNFDLTLPGLSRLGAPLPLGGTSNHFRTGVLRELNGWDPFNVTEDCDLGMRIGRRKHRTMVLDSTTYEEANSQIGNFIRQRSRWVKGFMQTHLVHIRQPLKLYRNLGLSGMIYAYLTVGGSVLMMLTNLICWPLILLYMGLLINGVCHGYPVMEQIIYRSGQPTPHVAAAWPLVYLGASEDALLSQLSIIFAVTGLLLFAANLLLIFVGMAAAVKRKYYHLVPAALLLPLYWVLISIGAWKGAVQLLYKPFYWEKTRHGLLDSDE